MFTGDELGSDSYPLKIVDDVYYEIEGKVRRFIRKKIIKNFRKNYLEYY